MSVFRLEPVRASLVQTVPVAMSTVYFVVVSAVLFVAVSAASSVAASSAMPGAVAISTADAGCSYREPSAWRQLLTMSSRLPVTFCVPYGWDWHRKLFTIWQLGKGLAAGYWLTLWPDWKYGW